MSFTTHGFLSHGMEKFRATLRSVPAYKQWFEFADDLNSLGLQMLDGLNVPLNDNQRLTIAALFARAHKSLQAAILLSEVGLVGDARTVLRSAVEGAIASNALANDAQFLDQLIEAHHHNQRKKAGLVLNNPDYRTIYTAKQIAEMEQTIKDVDSIEAAAGRDLRDVTWSNVAAKHCKDLYDLLYRLLSSDGTHTTCDSINRMFDYDPSAIPSFFVAGNLQPEIRILIPRYSSCESCGTGFCVAIIADEGASFQKPRFRSLDLTLKAQNVPKSAHF